MSVQAIAALEASHKKDTFNESDMSILIFILSFIFVLDVHPICILQHTCLVLHELFTRPSSIFVHLHIYIHIIFIFFFI